MNVVMPFSPVVMTRDVSSDAFLLVAARHDPGAFEDFYERYAERYLPETVNDTTGLRLDPTGQILTEPYVILALAAVLCVAVAGGRRAADVHRRRARLGPGRRAPVILDRRRPSPRGLTLAHERGL
jgi:hypothetical protein